ncbi:MAG: hypothetical protein RJB13_177, partial [Pseudomonadota bacterium]
MKFNSNFSSMLFVVFSMIAAATATAQSENSANDLSQANNIDQTSKSIDDANQKNKIK